MLNTDHKPILQIQTKPEFGTKKIQRWLERLSMLDFDVSYVKSKKLEQADILRRSLRKESDDDDDKFAKILAYHKNNGHRKSILKEVQNELGKQVTKSMLIRSLQKCTECCKKDKMIYKSAKYVQAFKLGERFAIDLMDYEKKSKVILGIDYFGRKLFGRVIESKVAYKVKDFVDSIYEQFKYSISQLE